MYMCKLYAFVNLSMAPISPMLMVYISCEKYVSIKYPFRKGLMRRQPTQLCYLIAMVAVSFAYHVPFIFYYQFQDLSTSISTVIF